MSAELKPGERIDDLQRGGLRIIQRENGFRFGTDAVLLADFAAAKRGERVCDMGTGTGVLPLLLSARAEGTTDAETMVKEGRAIYALDPKHMVVKIPMTAEGLKAIKTLSGEGIPTNCTLIFSANQALLAARAGAAYVSPFLGRLDDISQPGIELIRTIAAIFANYPDIRTQIIAASVRNPIHVTDCALAGADIATVPYKVIEQMTHHPLTDQGIEKFRQDYVKVFGE